MNIDETQPLGLPSNLPEIPDVRLLHFIGRGGMGVVYRGYQTYLERDVAVKLLGERSKGADYRARFQREAKILAGMSHPHIVTCYSAGVATDGSCYLVMEFVDGPSLRDFLDEHGQLDYPTAMRVCREVALALQHGHASEIIHRDVKPENILLQPKGNPKPDDTFPYHAKVVDLGLARSITDESVEMNITQPGQYMGSPATMAPEQFDDPDSVDHRADIYGLGCVLYHALAGHYAYSGRSLAVIISRKQSGKYEDLKEKRPDIPDPVHRLVKRMLETRPEDRPQSYDEIIAECDRFLEGRPGGSGLSRGQLGAAILATIIVVATVFFLWQDSRRNRAVDTAPRFRAVGNEATSEGERAHFEVEVANARVADYSFEWTLTAAGGGTIPLANATEPRVEFDLPPATAPYAYRLEVVVRDSDGGEAYREAIDVRVTADNDPPRVERLVAPDSAPAASPVALRAVARDSDDGVARYRWRIGTGEPIETTSAEFSWTPDSVDRPTPWTISVEAIDSGGNVSSPQVATIRVTPVNRAPVIERIVVTPRSVPEGGRVTLRCDARDPDGASAPVFAWSHVSGPIPILQDGVGWADLDGSSIELRMPMTDLAVLPATVVIEARVSDPEGAATTEREEIRLEAAPGTLFSDSDDRIELLLAEDAEEPYSLTPWKDGKTSGFAAWQPLAAYPDLSAEGPSGSVVVADRGYLGFAETTSWLETPLPRGRWQLTGRVFGIDPNDNDKLAKRFAVEIEVATDRWIAIELARGPHGYAVAYRSDIATDGLPASTTTEASAFVPLEFEVRYDTDSIELAASRDGAPVLSRHRWDLTPVDDRIRPRIRLVLHEGNGVFSELYCHGL